MEVVVCGAGVIGLATAMLLAGDGHEVTVLEADPAPPPDEPAAAWDWDRRGVPQFQQAHTLLPRFRQVVDEELPGLLDQLVEAGCPWIDPIESLPPDLSDPSRRADDDRFRYVTGRRPVVEATFARAAAERDGVDVRRGVAIDGLLARSDAGATPRVSGVRLASGDELLADLVVDATGRRTELPRWLDAIGARAPHIESEDSGFVYFTRYFTGPERPKIIGPPTIALGTFSILTIAGDNDTWSVTLWASARDAELRPLQGVDAWTNVVRRCPLQAHWLRGEPITDVLSAAGVLDRYRRYVVDDEPVATGVVAVGDAWACTNPSAGRGLSVGLIHAQQLRDAVRQAGDEPERLVRRFDELTESNVTPFYRNQIRDDRARIAEMDALRAGAEPPPPNPTSAAIGRAMMFDPDVFRGVVETVTCLALPQEVYARPGFMDRVATYADRAPVALPGPDRAALIRAVTSDL